VRNPELNGEMLAVNFSKSVEVTRLFTRDTLPYDPANPKSIHAYALLLEGKRLRDILASPDLVRESSGKGRLGMILEEYYFFRKPNSSPLPDFPQAGVELKSTPLKTVGKARLAAKERLVLNMIDYDALRGESWTHSSFLRKNSLLLLVFYRHAPNTKAVDLNILHTLLWSIPDEDLPTIQADWEQIWRRVANNEAHLLSESETRYLSACTKGANKEQIRSQKLSPYLAKSRAFSLKRGYVQYIYEKFVLGLNDAQPLVRSRKPGRGKTFEDVVQSEFAEHVGKTAKEIAQGLDVTIDQAAKNFHAAITKRVLGISLDKRIAEFEKAEIVIRTIRLKKSGLPKEDVSFPAFDPKVLLHEKWESSDFRERLTKRFFFVIYQELNGEYKLKQTLFWSMPLLDLEKEARWVWSETRRRLKSKTKVDLPKKSENCVAHVRPHGRNARDTVKTESGWNIVRQSFWLNGSYLQKRLNL
jgi:DNA mismatch repair protein MutH